MALCEMCGKESSLFRTKVEGSELRLCNNCSGYGKKVGWQSSSGLNNSQNGVRRFGNSAGDKLTRASNKYIPNQELELVSSFSQKVQSSRSRKNMTQEQFANMLSERVSVVQKWESGNLKPKIEVAKKLERILGVGLVKKIGTNENSSENDNDKEDSNGNSLIIDSSKSSSEFTLGDFIKVRKRR